MVFIPPPPLSSNLVVHPMDYRFDEDTRKHVLCCRLVPSAVVHCGGFPTDFSVDIGKRKGEMGNT